MATSVGYGAGSMVQFILTMAVAIVVLGISATVYSYEVNLRDTESMVLARNIIDCLSVEGVVDLDSFKGSGNDLFSYCGYDESEMERFFVALEISSGKYYEEEYVEDDSEAYNIVEEGLNTVKSEEGIYDIWYEKDKTGFYVEIDGEEAVIKTDGISMSEKFKDGEKIVILPKFEKTILSTGIALSYLNDYVFDFGNEEFVEGEDVSAGEVSTSEPFSYELTVGDETLEWVAAIYSGDFGTESIEAYEPGYYNGVFENLFILNEGVKREEYLQIEVIVKSDE